MSHKREKSCHESEVSYVKRIMDLGYVTGQTRNLSLDVIRWNVMIIYNYVFYVKHACTVLEFILLVLSARDILFRWLFIFIVFLEYL